MNTIAHAEAGETPDERAHGALRESDDNGSVMEAADRLVAAAEHFEDLLRAEDDGMIAA